MVLHQRQGLFGHLRRTGHGAQAGLDARGGDRPEHEEERERHHRHTERHHEGAAQFAWVAQGGHAAANKLVHEFHGQTLSAAFRPILNLAR
ncbi:hypothetical protein D9M68_870520 [compost metagenome]